MAGVRVLITVDAVGGVWQYGLDLARGLAERGLEPVLALLGPAADAGQRREASAIAGVTLIETGLPLDWLCDGPEPVLAATAAIAALAQDIGADLVQFNSPALVGAMPLPTVAMAHGCIATWWAAAYPGRPLAEQLRWHRDLMGRSLRSADRVVAPTASYAGMIANQYGLSQTPLVVHNGRKSLAGAALPMVDRVLTVGRLWDPVKRADLLDRAAAQLDVPFDAAGQVTGPQGQHAALAHLTLLGQIDAVALGRCLAARPVFVSAAAFEPFGLSVLEAANAGCALVLSDIASFRELWDGAALFVPGDDPAAYVRAIATLLADPGLRLRLGDAARSHAARYTPAAMADGMLAIFGEVLDTAHRQEGCGMKIVYFTHSLASCWNHGNAHFLRGVLSELTARGHDVQVWEPEGAWSLANLLADHGEAGLHAYRAAYPELKSSTYAGPPCERMVAGADLVIVHEWNEPQVVARIGHLRGARSALHPAVPRHPSPRGQRARSDARL